MVSLEAAARAEIQRGIARQRKGLKLQGGFWGGGRNTRNEAEAATISQPLAQEANPWRKGRKGRKGLKLHLRLSLQGSGSYSGNLFE